LFVTCHSTSTCIPSIVAFVGIQSQFNVKSVNAKLFVIHQFTFTVLTAEVVVVFNSAFLGLTQGKAHHHISVDNHAHHMFGFTSIDIVKFLSKVHHLPSSVLIHIS
jgi:hypothetical protein